MPDNEHFLSDLTTHYILPTTSKSWTMITFAEYTTI